ncbi:hypothetical protein MKK67_11365 [Methylobacterium sp. J-072]|uniref:hypothetical protein n=1 Tax=Methylobacterium sp. J-072 TaxID=2836651 RepID=UPI001FBB97EF|nr:hypothetical protein [Methylobacterium sp. J-072]MCJ2093093.1 hypothetical protein [Methylobacterium sp. J-072]
MSKQGNVETLVVLQPIAVDTGSPDRDGMLVIANGLLTAVLVRLAEPEHDDVGSWFFEVGFGRLQGKRAPTFLSLEEATRWLRRNLKAA